MSARTLRFNARQMRLQCESDDVTSESDDDVHPLEDSTQRLLIQSAALRDSVRNLEIVFNSLGDEALMMAARSLFDLHNRQQA